MFYLRESEASAAKCLPERKSTTRYGDDPIDRGACFIYHFGFFNSKKSPHSSIGAH
ncbi:hypothetical protein [Lysinibacillus sp. fls2-241-R2A-57]|uniref:hypothetical protein n=1 Tax=Lysinibacillus sp. fls2-241-R2A-57 TaxID=3040292 RepID=UPI002557651A|nr:hypothetical protein [Lysinibacillus sp. fls2-241-R2A-57]